MAALSQSEKHLIKEVVLNANAKNYKTNDLDWQDIEVDFNSPRSGYRSYRVLVEFEVVGTVKSKTQLDIDDFSLIEWQTAYSNSIAPPLFNLKSKQASFIGVNFAPNNSLFVSFQ